MNENDPCKENADLVRAIEDAPPRGDIPMPEHVIFALERARRDALKRPLFARHFLRIAAAFLLLGALAWQFIPRSTATARVVVTSPGDSIASTRPTVAWNSKDALGQLYDVWILPGNGDHLTAKALFKAEKVVSPVQFAALKPASADAELHPGGSYRVLICLASAGRMAGVPVPFSVAPLRK